MGDREADRILVERVQAGDKQAFGLLVTKYQRKLARLIGRMVRDPAEVEDIVQDSFIRAYRALPGFRNDSAFYTWLYRIGVNTAKNWLVTHGRKVSATDRIDGLSYEEIAQVMDCPIGTVRSRIFRARDAISAKLRPLLDAAPDKRW